MLLIMITITKSCLILNRVLATTWQHVMCRQPSYIVPRILLNGWRLTIYFHWMKQQWFSPISARQVFIQLSECIRNNQGRPLNVKHDARCVMVKVEGEGKIGKK